LLSENAQDHLYRWLGEYIKSIRQKKKLTQENLAQATGFTRVSIANIEGGKQKVQLHTLIDIANYLEISFIELLGTIFELTNQNVENRIAKEIDPQNSEGYDSVKEFYKQYSSNAKKD